MASREETMKALQTLASQAEAIAQQMNLIQNAISEANEAREALRGIETSAEVLYPLGAGVYLIGEVKDAERVLMSAGSGVVIKRNREEAISLLEERVKDLNKRLEELASRYNEIVAEMEKIRERLQVEEKK